MANPDGYYHNEVTNPDGGGLWRKNARDNDTDGVWFESVDGVDLNRNFGYEWGYDNMGSSPVRSSEIYRGPDPFSEPETAAQRDLLCALAPATGLSFHASGGYLLHPWGYVPQATADSALFDRWSDEATRGTVYMAGPTSQVLYATNGDFNDWAYGDTLSKPRIFSWVPEIGTSADGFWPAAVAHRAAGAGEPAQVLHGRGHRRALRARREPRARRGHARRRVPRPPGAAPAQPGPGGHAR